MSIDWAATGSWMQAWADFAQAGIILGAAIIARNTFNSWRKQRIEERRIEIAERLLTTVYRAKRAFSVVRSPVTSRASFDEATYNLIESGVELESYPESKRKKIVEAQVVFDRMNSFKGIWDDFSEVTPIASALFGPRIETLMSNIWKQKSSIQVAAEQYPTDPGDDQQFTAQLAATIWENRQRLATPDDRIGKDLAEAIANLEKELLPVIRTTP